MRSAKLRAGIAGSAALLALLGCTNLGGGMAAKSSDGIPLGASERHPVQPLADKPRFGQLVSEADIAPWNIDVRTSDGQGLPAGRGSVAEGRKVYEARCASCHGPDAKGGPVYGTMVGGIGSFTTSARVLTPGSMYPYAPILFDYIRRAMPMDKPQSLSANEVYAVSAYLLNLNGLVPADAVMDASNLPKVQMPNRNGFILDDRPDTKAVRCMTNCK
jgi:S-disulfanyl-L-cysteine oxidoreductase SoxD